MRIASTTQRWGFAFLTLFILACPSCRKNSDATNADSVTAARQFVESNISHYGTGVHNFGTAAGPGKPVWSAAITKRLSKGIVVFVPIEYSHPYLIGTNLFRNQLFDINHLQYLVIYQHPNDKNSQHSVITSVITYFPDSNNQHLFAFTGIIRQEDWNGNLMATYKYEKNGVVRKLGSASGARKRQASTEDLYLLRICYAASGYNYMASDPENGYYWEIDLGCDEMFIAEPIDGSDGEGFNDIYLPNWEGGSLGGFNSQPSFSVVGGNNIIADIKDYNRCFDNIAGTKSYTVTICVDQPISGIRDTWGLSGAGSSASGNPVSVGHTFLVLTETGFNGTITRNIGFYPRDEVSPAHPVSQGQLNNDANHDYNIALSISLTNSEFFLMLDFINHANDAGYNYDLNSNNCTNFAVNALGAAGIVIPATRGNWPGGEGLNPGDFGEDIRGMQLSPNMTRNSTFNNHPNLGTCY